MSLVAAEPSSAHESSIDTEFRWKKVSEYVKPLEVVSVASLSIVSVYFRRGSHHTTGEEL